MKKHFTACDGKTGQRGPIQSSKTAGCEINPPCALLDEQPKTERPQSCKFSHHKGKNKYTFPPKGNFKKPTARKVQDSDLLEYHTACGCQISTPGTVRQTGQTGRRSL